MSSTTSCSVHGGAKPCSESVASLPGATVAVACVAAVTAVVVVALRKLTRKMYVIF